jgi:3-deoxy-D-manno-octulosonate 8-phosphate phosphatase (KDO 8-P phosphatase)
VAVADAAEEVRESADHVTTTPGGRGAVRELVESLLKSSDAWTSTSGAMHG